MIKETSSALSVLLFSCAAVAAEPELPIDPKLDAAIKAYVDCNWDKAAELDDSISDATTIAEGVKNACMRLNFKYRYLSYKDTFSDTAYMLKFARETAEEEGKKDALNAVLNTRKVTKKLKR